MLPLVLLLLLAADSRAADFSGAQVLHVAKDVAGLVDKIVSQQNLDVWSGNLTHLDVLVPGRVLAGVKQVLAQSGVSFAIKVPDVAKAVLEASAPATVVRTISRAGYRMNWDQYQRLQVFYDFLDSLGRAYPNLVTVGSIGTTAEGRPIKYVKISSGRPNAKAVFIDGGIHAREWVSPASVSWMIRELVENRNSLPRELLELDFYVLPVLNPDGYEYTHTGDRMWRKNRSGSGRCRGADINRNFAYRFGGKGTSGDACSDIYRGPGPASENESRALQAFLSGIRNLKAYITFHSYGQYILIPFGHDYNSLPADFNEMLAVGTQAAQAIQRFSGSRYTVGNTASTLYPAAGGSDDWTKGTLSGVRYAYCIELRDGPNSPHGFLLPPSQILPTAREAFEAVKVIAAAAARA